VKNKENIFEELNKMKSLIYVKAGTVISEQAQAQDPIETIRKELKSMAIGSFNEEAIVNTIVSNYKTKEQFANFLSQFKQKTGQDFANELKSVITPSEKPQWDALVKHLAGIGVTMKAVERDNRFNGIAFDGLTSQPAASTSTRTPEAVKAITSTFCGVRGGKITAGAYKDQPWTNYKTLYKVTDAEEAEAQKTCPTAQTGVATSTRTPEAMKNITSTFCGVKGGKITAGAFKDKPWADYKATYKVTDAEEQEARKSCPVGGSGSGQRSGQSSVNNRFASSVKSLGIQGDKMDLQTLQSILNTLEGGQSTAAATGTPAAATTGTPDIAQLTAALNQLQA
jgi:putative hemolysin